MNINNNNILHINDIPNALFGDVATYLAKPSRAFFAMAMTAPSSSWREFRWNYGRPSAVGISILSSTQDSDSLDFGDIEKKLAEKLTDADVRGVLWCINSKETLKILRLTGCINITGIGLAPLRGSIVLQQIDLSLVGYQESPKLEPEPAISEAAVLPILNSIDMRGNNSFKHIQLPVKWRQRRSTELGEFLKRYHKMMECQRLCCSKCDKLIQYADDDKWYADDGDEWYYGLSNYTCCKCIEHFCDDHEDDEGLRFCIKCERDFCTSCVPLLETCECGNGICKKCGELPKCEGCQRYVCEHCMCTCECCNVTRCWECKPFVECEGKGCHKNHFEDCFDGKDYDVQGCDVCEKYYCLHCRYLDWSKELENACSGCEAIIPCSKIEEEIEKVEKKIEKVEKKGKEQAKEFEEERDAKQKLIDSLEEDVEFLKTITEQIET